MLLCSCCATCGHCLRIAHGHSHKMLPSSKASRLVSGSHPLPEMSSDVFSAQWKHQYKASPSFPVPCCLFKCQSGSGCGYPLARKVLCEGVRSSSRAEHQLQLWRHRAGIGQNSIRQFKREFQMDRYQGISRYQRSMLKL